MSQRDYKMFNRIEEITNQELMGIFTDKFIQDHSSFKSFKQLWDHNESKLKNQMLPHEYIKTEEWNDFIKENTDFDDYKGMEFAAKIFGFKSNRKHWFGDD